jgi:hypothetical protein
MSEHVVSLSKRLKDRGGVDTSGIALNHCTGQWRCSTNETRNSSNRATVSQKWDTVRQEYRDSRGMAIAVAFWSSFRRGRFI